VGSHVPRKDDPVGRFRRKGDAELHPRADDKSPDAAYVVAMDTRTEIIDVTKRYAGSEDSSGQARALQVASRRARAHDGARRAGVAPADSEAVRAHRRFLAYAAHELRSGITLQVSLAEATLADPNADSDDLRQMGREIVAACWRQERLLEALLTLARSESEHLRHEPVDLAATAREALRAHDHHDLTWTTTLEPARTSGDPQLIARLVANLVANAIRHNIPGGRLRIGTRATARRAILTMANTGPLIAPGDLTRIFQPFQRLSPSAGPGTDGVGLGLAIVQAIANAHDATVTAQAPTGGGLVIDVAFPLLSERNQTPCAVEPSSHAA
jgi:signal transduction histidine kinase